jgi:hypothetical protein
MTWENRLLKSRRDAEKAHGKWISAAFQPAEGRFFGPGIEVFCRRQERPKTADVPVRRPAG